jgi:hypothetical protein
LATKAHFSSNWTSRVSGGKGHDLVVGVLGMLAGQDGQPGDGVLADPYQPCGLSGTTAIGEVLQNPRDLVVGEFGVEVRRSLKLGEPSFAGIAVEEAMVPLAEAAADREIAGAALTVVRALRVLAAIKQQVVRGHESSWVEPG